jgi:NADH:ubiquinone oxidoreductase subunit 6 (subunit J)
MTEMIFYSLAGLTILSGLAILAGRSLVGLGCSLIVMLTAVSGLIFIKGDWTAAAAQFILLAVGVGCFFLRAMRRLAKSGVKKTASNWVSLLWAVPLFTLLTWGMIYNGIFAKTGGDWAVRALPRAEALIDAGVSLLSFFIGPFLLLGILLMIVLLGAAHLIDYLKPTDIGANHVEKKAECEIGKGAEK